MIAPDPCADGEPLAIPTLGYTDRWSVRPGETVQFMVSCGTPYDVEIVRITGRGPRPLGHGEPLSWERIPSTVDGNYCGRRQQIVSGSYGIVDRDRSGAPGAAMMAWIYPTLPAAGRGQIILAWPGDASGSGLELGVDEGGQLMMSYPRKGGDRGVVVAPDPLTERTWCFVGGSVEAATGRVAMVRHVAKPGNRGASTFIELFDDAMANLRLGPRIVIGAGGTRAEEPAAFSSVVEGGYNGKIEWPSIRAAGLSASQLLSGADSKPSDCLLDHAELTNAPMERVTGHLWSGDTLDWRTAPTQYEAVWFHDDDLADAKWPVAFEWSVPADTRSGMYAARVNTRESEDILSFYVSPSDSGPRAGLAVLIPTFTYTVYSNFAHPNRRPLPDAPLSEDMQAEAFLAKHPELGLSLYCEHRDGSGVSHVTSRRPMVDMRPWHRISTRGNAGRELSGDLYLIDWLEAQGVSYDIVTDHDLHTQGLAALAPYSGVVTGGHPEYSSREMLDGLKEYICSGGNLAYLGGNGFYWVTSVSSQDPAVLEVRRGSQRVEDLDGRAGRGPPHYRRTGRALARSRSVPPVSRRRWVQRPRRRAGLRLRANPPERGSGGCLRLRRDRSRGGHRGFRAQAQRSRRRRDRPSRLRSGDATRHSRRRHLRRPARRHLPTSRGGGPRDESQGRRIRVPACAGRHDLLREARRGIRVQRRFDQLERQPLVRELRQQRLAPDLQRAPRVPAPAGSF